MHGVDVTPIMRWDMPWSEMVVGVLEIFILGWLFGAIIAVFYNVGVKETKASGSQSLIVSSKVVKCPLRGIAFGWVCR